MIERTEFESGTFYLGDCFEVMVGLEEGRVDMVLADLPYGTTQCKWDSVIDLSLMWSFFEKKCKGSVILTAAFPFTAILAYSNIHNLKYSLVWEKGKATGHLNAKKQHLRAHEDILVFGGSIYNPQGTVEKEFISSRPAKGQSRGEVYGKQTSAYKKSSIGNYPRSVLRFSGEHKPIHPTQKPVALFEYLIRTYTNEGQLVLDNTAGSGTTAIAAMNAGRRWICIEKDETYYRAAVERVRKHEEKMKEAA